jgi:hypothetical protein
VTPAIGTATSIAFNPSFYDRRQKKNHYAQKLFPDSIAGLANPGPAHEHSNFTSAG